MIKAVLLDLDETLLHTGDQAFTRAYLALAESYFAQQYQRPGMGQALIGSLQAMASPRPWHLSNTDAALTAIDDGTRSLASLTAAFATFYEAVYPALKAQTRPIDGAAALIERLIAQEYAVVIATNPVYPAEAIRQRMAWAGLPSQLDAPPYAFVTHGDNMHFIKPNPAYYAEILARVGVEPDEAVMVGNDLENDIIPAACLGLNTYHITDAPQVDTPADSQGTLADFAQAVQAGWLETLAPKPLQPSMIRPELTGNIGALFGLMAEVKPHQWQQHPIVDEWSIIQVVQHMLDRERTVQRPRLQTIYTQDNPFIRSPASPEKPVPANPDGLRLAEAFADERQQTLAFLDTVTGDGWQRPAQHSIFGNTTLLEMAHFTAQHDRMHINQICQTLGRCD